MSAKEKAWDAVCYALNEHSPDWATKPGTGLECAVAAIAGLADAAKSAQGGRVDERAAFEQWYAQNAHDYERNPIGSRECGLQWKAWQAALAQNAQGEAVSWRYWNEKSKSWSSTTSKVVADVMQSTGRDVQPLYLHPERARVPDDGRYYIQDSRHHTGNCPMWWAKDGKGYVTRLDEAQRYTLDEAMKQHRSRETDIPWACAEIDAMVRPTVDVQYMRPIKDQVAMLAAAPQPEGGES